jgi:diacylglycerol O-acyltransferase
MIDMAGADAYFLYEETPARHMHTIKVVVFDPTGAFDQVDPDRVRQGVMAALPYQVALRRRPLRIPLGLGRPLWLETLDLDPDYHVRHHVLASGADDTDLDELVGRIASEPLDEERPLWQVHFVEGLPGGHMAYVTKIHHAVADGMASAELVARLFQADPARYPLPSRPPPLSEATPSAARRVAHALRVGLSRQGEVPSLLARALRTSAQGLDRWWRGLPMPLRPFSGPHTRFNRPLTANRVYAHTTLALDDLRRVKTAFGCTVNDVYLTLCGGALRSYLERHGELPARALTAAIPVSLRSDGDDPVFGNATFSWFASTCSDVADPVERLAAVAASTRVAREQFAARDTRLALDWLDHWTLRRLYLDGFQVLAGKLLRRPSFNVIVSNVPGPREALYADGSRVVALYSMGPLARHQGLNFTAWSYRNDFSIGVHACREHVPDVRMLLEPFAVELARLTRAAQQREAAGAAGPREPAGGAGGSAPSVRTTSAALPPS